MSAFVSFELRPVSSNTKRSRLLETRISILGELVNLNSRSRLYVPVWKKSTSTSFSFEAQMSLLIGTPIPFA